MNSISGFYRKRRAKAYGVAVSAVAIAIVLKLLVSEKYKNILKLDNNTDKNIAIQLSHTIDLKTSRGWKQNLKLHFQRKI